jgi:hypothetical protein
MKGCYQWSAWNNLWPNEVSQNIPLTSVFCVEVKGIPKIRGLGQGHS